MANDVVMTLGLEAQDNASPSILGVGRSLVMLGANLAWTARAFGMEAEASNRLVNSIMLVGHVMRALNAIKAIGALVSKSLAVSNVAEAGGHITAAGAALGHQVLLTSYTGTTVGATVATWGFVAALKALALAHPLGILALALGLVGAGIAGGYALGGFGGGATTARPEVRTFGMGEGGKYAERTVQVTVIAPNLTSMGDKKKAKETFQEAGTIVWEETRGYRAVG